MESIFCSSSLLSDHHHNSSLKVEKKPLGVGIGCEKIGVCRKMNLLKIGLKKLRMVVSFFVLP